MSPRILLVDRSGALADAWSRAFEDVEGVEIHRGDLFERDADAIVSPANSFGIMDGGVDRAIRDALGFAVERALQQRIVERHHGELVVGAAEVIATGHARWPWLVAAPTMRIPESVAASIHAYLAFRAALLAAAAHPIASIACPGMATGIGGMDPQRCAVQMRVALDHVRAPARIASFDRIHALHRALRTA